MRTEAILAASEQLEQLMSVSYNHADLNSTGNPHVEWEPASPNAIYRKEWVIIGNAPTPNTLTIQLTVCWQENRGAPSSCAPAAGLKTVYYEFIRANL